MAKKPNRTWAMVMSLGIPLAIVGVSAMAISYATLIDVARVNGLPLPELFPVVVDVGTVATMIAAAQFRMRGVPGRWLAYTTFILLSGVSIVANATHAWRAADLTLTSPWAAAILASTPPTALLAITHLVMMLIPDEKERAKLQAKRERMETIASKPLTPQRPAEVAQTPLARAAVAPSQPAPASPPAVVPEHATLRLVDAEIPEDEVRTRVLEYVKSEGKRPTGKLVGEWLGDKTPKTGQRFIKRLEEDGAFDDEPARAAAHVVGVQ
ncbi:MULTISPECIES: hypothetical protein [Leucobacter]|uniref:DUF2637 domain-containing protein n=1 Tax=Leucobacter chromiiresistens TaxID=1079994 RepID=A0A1H0YJQ1_9MICO|nr:hypothetical protein [Leucobacter chromiiresistens]SDQ15414.1 hypothetical protein SAMN04488565_0940 [Leucobacter chromiiresistens]